MGGGKEWLEGRGRIKLQQDLVRGSHFYQPERGKDEQIGFVVLTTVLCEMLPTSYGLKKVQNHRALSAGSAPQN